MNFQKSILFLLCYAIFFTFDSYASKYSFDKVSSKQVCNSKGCANPNNPPPQSNKVEYNSWCCILGMSCCGGEEKPLKPLRVD
jgi:hypothetical protein